MLTWQKSEVEWTTADWTKKIGKLTFDTVPLSILMRSLFLPDTEL